MNGWMVRAGVGGDLIDLFSEGLVAIGWKELGSLNSFNSREQLQERYLQKYPDDKRGKVANAVSVLYKFAHCIFSRRSSYFL